MDINVDNEHPTSKFVANPEEVGIVFLWEVCVRLQDYTVFQPGTL